MTEKEIFTFLDEKAEAFNHPNFIELDPIQIPHRFSLKQDVEIAGFLTATIAWGNRKSIIQDAGKMMNFMGNNPYDFIMNVREKDLKHFENQSIHRTFNGEDFAFFASSMILSISSLLRPSSCSCLRCPAGRGATCPR